MMVWINKFWRFWFFKTPQEIKYVVALKEYIDELFRRINKKQVISIYLIGSFPRRDMRPDSDIDVKLITHDDADLDKLRELREVMEKEFKDKTGVRIALSFYTVAELISGNFNPDKQCGRRLPPWKFSEHLEHAKRIFGKKLESRDFHKKSDREKLKIAWHLAGRYIEKHWREESEYDRLALTAKHTMDLIHQIDNFERGLKTDFIKRELVAKFQNDETHVVHALWDVLQHPEKYQQPKERKEVYDKIKAYLAQTKEFCEKTE